jgi:hypothetical protein
LGNSGNWRRCPQRGPNGTSQRTARTLTEALTKPYDEHFVFSLPSSAARSCAQLPVARSSYLKQPWYADLRVLLRSSIPLGAFLVEPEWSLRYSQFYVLFLAVFVTKRNINWRNAIVIRLQLLMLLIFHSDPEDLCLWDFLSTFYLTTCWNCLEGKGTGNLASGGISLTHSAGAVVIAVSTSRKAGAQLCAYPATRIRSCKSLNLMLGVLTEL